MVIVAGLAVAWSRTKEALAAGVVPTAVCFSFAMVVLEVALLLVAACVVSGSPSPRTVFPLWLLPCCAIEHTFGFDIPIREALALDCVYAFFAIDGLGGGSAGGGGLCGIRSFVLAGLVLLVVVVALCHL